MHSSAFNSPFSILHSPLKCVATIGSFDGVHRGHRSLLGQVRSMADERGLRAAAVTFDTAPKRVLEGSGNARTSLTTRNERVELLRQAGMDEVALLTFTHEMAQLTAREFMEQVLKEQLGVEVLVIGYDHRFGRGRSEGFDDYVRYGEELGIEVVRGEACMDGCEAVSSTRIRRCIKEGRIAEANSLLGYCYLLEGEVVDGYKVGRKIGFPTANIRVSDEHKLLPADGVYAVRVNVVNNDDANENDNYHRDGNNCQLSIVNCQLGMGMLNIGHRPTVNNGEERSIEVHILDFEGDLYGRSLRLEVMERLRDEKPFESLDDLIAQLNADKERVREMNGEW